MSVEEKEKVTSDPKTLHEKLMELLSKMGFDVTDGKAVEKLDTDSEAVRKNGAAS